MLFIVSSVILLFVIFSVLFFKVILKWNCLWVVLYLSKCVMFLGLVMLLMVIMLNLLLCLFLYSVCNMLWLIWLNLFMVIFIIGLFIIFYRDSVVFIIVLVVMLKCLNRLLVGVDLLKVFMFMIVLLKLMYLY